MPTGPEIGNSWWKRLGWFVLIWACSVAVLGLAAYGMRLLMRLAGLAAV
ncbi:DUF2474 domain-containing protein [Noviherbaspirillum sp.]|nr:DUF2474 domain-containing protein [Noviherbaspirillum sp.]